MNRSHLLLATLASLTLTVACGDSGGDEGTTLGGSVGGSSGAGGGAAGKSGSGTSGTGASAGSGGGQAGQGGTGTSGKGGAAGKAGASGKGGAAGAGGKGGAAGAAGGAGGGKAGSGGSAGATGGAGGGKAGSGGSTGGSAGATGGSAGATGGSAGATGGKGGSAGATGGSAGATGGSAGSAGATGGSGGGCSQPSDCPQPPAMCVTATCIMGMCGIGNVAPGTPTVVQAPGDCHQSVCDGNGGQMMNVDDADVPVDGTTCTDDVCTNGTPSNPPVALGTVCTDPANGGQVCDAAGKCVQCNDPVDCGGGMCTMNVCVPVLLISEVQTRGSAGASDEFVEIYNPMSVAVTFDATWKLESRSSVAGAYSGRFAGSGQSIPPHGHLLIVGSAYGGGTASDGALTSSVTDAGALRLTHGGATVDTVCFFFDNNTFAALDATYGCEGMPVSNFPHNNGGSGMSASNVSIERKPGGALGNGVDTNDSAADFAGNTPSNPQDLASMPVP